MSNGDSEMIALAALLADRLLDCGEVRDRSSEGRDASGFGIAGDAGVALFFAALLQARDEPRYREAFHTYMKAAAHTGPAGILGLFTGLHGLLAVCRYSLLVETRYAGLLERSASAVETHSARAAGRLVPPAYPYDYDVISGRAGEAIAMALALSPERAREACDYLAWVLEDERRWHCPHPSRPAEGPVFDLGVAHGLAGMVAALAISAPNEQRYRRAMEIGVGNLCERRLAPSGVGWPVAIESAGPRYGPQAWCYGTPGCAAALFSAATRLERWDQVDVARKALCSLARQPQGIWNVRDYALCHGYAGNALIFSSIAGHTGDQELRNVSEELVARLIAGFEPSTPFGYRAAGAKTEHEDTPDALGGTAGIGLALLTLAGACDPSWMAFFAIPPLRRGARDYDAGSG